MEAAKRLASITNWTKACLSLGIARASAYRFCKRKDNPVPSREPITPERALSDNEMDHILDVLHSERIVGMPLSEIYVTLLDEGVYHCSISTMYRILNKNEETRQSMENMPNPSCLPPGRTSFEVGISPNSKPLCGPTSISR